MTIADLIQSTIESSKERLKTPITGAFICSFVVYNWQPILILFFSESSIEKRIEVANSYFDIVAFLWPVLMAFAFTILIPLLMWGLDTINIFAKKKRLGKTYENKRNLILEKIKIADDINDLKNAESGNKEKQDYLDQIKSLEETIEQLQQSKFQIELANKNSIDQLNSKLKEANEINENLLSNIPEKEYAKLSPQKLKNSLRDRNDEHTRPSEIELKAMAEGIFMGWQLEQIFTITDLDKKDSNNIDGTELDFTLLTSLRALGVLEPNEKGRFRLTNYGKEFIEYLKKKNSTDYKNFKINNELN